MQSSVSQQPVTEVPQPAPPAGPLRALSREEVAAIRARRSEMSDQLTSAANRRERLVDELRGAPPGTQQGLLDRITVLDQRIQQIETDIASTGRMLTSGLVAEGTVLVPPRTGFASDQMLPLLTMSFSFFVLLPIALVVVRRFWRRPLPSPVESREQAARMERLEQAVDAIAIEIERVGEAQRYQARILSEANLMPALNAAQPAAEPIRIRQLEEVPSSQPGR